MALTVELNASFLSLLAVTLFSAVLTGSSFQWVVSKGLFEHGWKNHRKNQYNILVAIASISALIQTVTCFVNATLLAPDHHVFGFSLYIVANWIIMTHSSVMLVSRKLSLTYLDSERVWRRLLLINVVMLPFSIFIAISWALSHNIDDSSILDRINRISEPIQIALWGIIEFCLSGMFVIKMWKFHWTAVERKGIFVLFLVALLDTMSVLLNLFIGDLESTCVKGLVYSLRIRLEISVLCSVVDFVNSKRRSTPVYNSSRLAVSLPPKKSSCTRQAHDSPRSSSQLQLPQHHQQQHQAPPQESSSTPTIGQLPQQQVQQQALPEENGSTPSVEQLPQQQEQQAPPQESSSAPTDGKLQQQEAPPQENSGTPSVGRLPQQQQQAPPEENGSDIENQSSTT